MATPDNTTNGMVPTNNTALKELPKYNKDEEPKRQRVWQARQRQRLIKELTEARKKFTKLQDKVGKYKFSTFFSLTFAAVFVDLIDPLIDFLWSTGILMPIGFVVWFVKQLFCLIIWLRIHSITIDQETGESFLSSFAAILVEIVPFINVLPATTARVFKAWHAAHLKFEEHRTEINGLLKQIASIERQLQTMDGMRLRFA